MSTKFNKKTNSYLITQKYLNKQLIALTFKYTFYFYSYSKALSFKAIVIIAIKLCIVNKNENVIIRRAPQCKRLNGKVRHN